MLNACIDKPVKSQLEVMVFDLAGNVYIIRNAIAVYRYSALLHP
jgi:hypothetical protein